MALRVYQPIEDRKPQEFRIERNYKDKKYMEILAWLRNNQIDFVYVDYELQDDILIITDKKQAFLFKLVWTSESIPYGERKHNF